MSDDDDEQERVKRQLAWSAKQGRILTAHGQAAEYFTSANGFGYETTELPHYYFFKDNAQIFDEWKQQQTAVVVPPAVVGAWKRPLFYGGWESSTDRDEDVYNVQTHRLFVDLRLPTTRLLRRDSVSGLQDLTVAELRQYARQHVFAGYTVCNVVGEEENKAKKNGTTSPYPYVCTRHHCIDWNFAGTPRNRPNKWWVELGPPDNNSHNNVWKEWAYATDPHGQHYYCERWERHPDLDDDGDDDTRRPVVALRRLKTKSSSDADDYERDGVLVIVGDHFNYVLGRTEPLEQEQSTNNNKAASLVQTVDAALEQGNLDLARRWLSIEAGHGRISTGWRIDAAIQYWTQGQPLWEKQNVHVQDDDTMVVIWNGHPWQVFESNLEDSNHLQALLWKNL